MPVHPSNDAVEGQSDRITWNDVALFTGIAAGLVLLVDWALGWFFIPFEWSPYPPASVYFSHSTVHAFAVVGGMAGALGTDDARNGFNAWICAIALYCAATAASLSWYPFGYPEQGPHEFLVAATTGVLALVFGAIVLRWTLVGQTPRRWTMLALLLAVAFSAIAAPGVARRNLDTHLPLLASIERSRSADIQDYSSFLVIARPVNLHQATRYAERIGIPARVPGQCQTQGDAVAQPCPVTWLLDERTRMSDASRYPSGYSGCRLTVSWAGDTLRVSEQCDWGI